MGSQRRKAAQDVTVRAENGKILENAAAARRRLRQEAAIVREDLVLHLYARGETVKAIEDRCLAEYGVAYRRQVPEMVKRALTRRAEAYAQDVEEARTQYLTSQRQLYEAYMPYAVGDAVDPNTGMKLPPDPKMALIALRILDNIAEVTGGKAPRKAGDVNVNIGVVLPDNPDAERANVLEQITKEREKIAVLEGTFRETGGVEGATGVPADSLPPPVIDFPLGPAPD